jgi:guanylate kinase
MLVIGAKHVLKRFPKANNVFVTKRIQQDLTAKIFSEASDLDSLNSKRLEQEKLEKAACFCTCRQVSV